jgi:hypothetical protein
MQYRVFASLAEESNSGWVWLWETDKLKSRMIAKIVHDGRNVFCECRAIDGNFLNQYNQPPRISIPNNQKDALVIGKWYRDALGGIETQKDVSLTITPAKIPAWRAFRAAAHHPDLVARLATYLGAFGVWSGVCSLVASFLPADVALYCVSARVITSLFALLFGVVCLAACRPVAR